MKPNRSNIKSQLTDWLMSVAMKGRKYTETYKSMEESITDARGVGGCPQRTKPARGAAIIPPILIDPCAPDAAETTTAGFTPPQSKNIGIYIGKKLPKYRNL